jgi:hypothetical protein
MVPINGKSNCPGFHCARLYCTRRPMVDAVNGWVSEPLLKSFRIFSKIMQQPDHFGLASEAKRGCKSFSQQRHVAKMRGQGLPAILTRIGFPIRQRCRVREEFHARFLAMLLPGRGIFIAPGGK